MIFDTNFYSVPILIYHSFRSSDFLDRETTIQCMLFVFRGHLKCRIGTFSTGVRSTCLMGRGSCCTISTTGFVYGVCCWALHPQLRVVQGDVWWAIGDGMGHGRPQLQFRTGVDLGDIKRSTTTRWNLGQSSWPHLENYAMADRLIFVQDGVTLTDVVWRVFPQDARIELLPWPSPNLNLIEQIWD